MQEKLEKGIQSCEAKIFLNKYLFFMIPWQAFVTIISAAMKQNQKSRAKNVWFQYFHRISNSYMSFLKNPNLRLSSSIFKKANHALSWSSVLVK